MQDDEKIENYNLGSRAIGVLLRAGIDTISKFKALSRTDVEKLFCIQGCGTTTLAEIRNFLRNEGWNKPIAKPECQSLAYPSLEGMSPKQVVEYFLSLLQSERDREIVRYRWGLWDRKELTLDELGAKLSITRERVRQLQSKAELRLKVVYPYKIARKWLLKMRRRRIKAYLTAHGGMAKVEEILSQDATDDGLALVFLAHVLRVSRVSVAVAFAQKGGLVFSEPALLDRFEKAEEASKQILISHGKPMTLNAIFSELGRYQFTEEIKFLKRCFEVSDEIGFDRGGHACLRAWDCFNPQYITEMAAKALLQMGHPAHFTHIVDKMNLLFPERAPFSVHSVHGRLGTDESKFVCVRPGVYALKNWGIKRPPYIKDFLAQTLMQRGGVASIDALIAEGRSRHGYKETSMRMTLGLNPHIFKVLPDGTCKLL